MFQVGNRIQHAGHGLGTIVAFNGTPPNQYFNERPREVLELVEQVPQLSAGLVSSFYSSDRYPYVVRFDSGYQDVYSEGDLTLA